MHGITRGRGGSGEYGSSGSGRCVGVGGSGKRKGPDDASSGGDGGGGGRFNRIGCGMVGWEGQPWVGVPRLWTKSVLPSLPPQ